MPQNKLYYFDSRGYAEPARMIFAHAGVPFEDVRIEREQFKKADWPFGKLPVLEMDGKKLPESMAIIRYLAKQHGLAGKNDFESAEIDAIVYLWKDFFNDIMPYFRIVCGLLEGDKDKVRKAEFEPALEKYVPILEQLLKESGNGFLHKSGLSWADFVAANFFFQCRKHLEEFGKFAALNEHCDRVHSLPKVKEWVARRPDTKF
ncbi:GST protein [Aphelenchoides fujianensis]|nr:GST protein [Aphelenchoides fujianensis]